MRYSTSLSHEWDHAREEFLSLAKEQARNQSLQMARVIGPVRKALRECGINGDPLADVRRQPQTLRHQFAKVAIARRVPPHIYSRNRQVIDQMIDTAVQTHQGPL